MDKKFITSTQIGHSYIKPDVFPGIGLKRTFTKPFANQHTVVKGQKPDYYSTTTGSYHDYKSASTVVSNEIQKRSPGNWKVNYVDDTIRKLQMKPWRRSLTMENQSSEMKDQYCNKSTLIQSRHFCNDVIPAGFKNGENAKNTSTHAPVRQYQPNERGVLTYYLDPYLTTTKKDHRPFTTNEIDQFSKPKQATYWLCEDYPKAWGFGGKMNPLPPDAAPIRSETMRDKSQFPSQTTIPRTGRSHKKIPNKSFRSETMDSYTNIDSRKRSLLFQSIDNTPWNFEVSKEKDDIFVVPKMYQIESQYYGSEIPVVV